MFMQNETLKKAIGKNIREGRRRAKITQLELAERVGISTQSLSSLENGLAFARMETYIKIGDILTMPIHMIFYISSPSEGRFVEQLRFLTDHAN